MLSKESHGVFCVGTWHVCHLLEALRDNISVIHTYLYTHVLGKSH